jgi:4-hydroxy-3-methylbut-2-enyl diphosphate reductase
LKNYGKDEGIAEGAVSSELYAIWYNTLYYSLAVNNKNFGVQSWQVYLCSICGSFDVFRGLHMDKGKKNLEIVVSKYKGFCYGVKRAIDIVSSELSSGKKVYTFSEIIHNRTVMDELKNKGLRLIKVGDIANVTDGAIILPAHGVSKDVMEVIESRKMPFINLICPFVLQVYNVIKKFISNKIELLIIFGDKEHTEVKSIRSYLQVDNVVVNSAEEIAKIEFNKYKTIGIVSQTTQNRRNFIDIVDRLRKMCLSCGIKLYFEDTVCKEAESRQNEVKEIASRVDVMFIIGGKNSANTKRLYEIASLYQDRVFHIESIEEFCSLWPEVWDLIKDIQSPKIGITGGTSTPYYVIDEIAEELKKFYHFCAK